MNEFADRAFGLLVGVECSSSGVGVGLVRVDSDFERESDKVERVRELCAECGVNYTFENLCAECDYLRGLDAFDSLLDIDSADARIESARRLARAEARSSNPTLHIAGEGVETGGALCGDPVGEYQILRRWHYLHERDFKPAAISDYCPDCRVVADM